MAEAAFVGEDRTVEERLVADDREGCRGGVGTVLHDEISFLDRHRVVVRREASAIGGDHDVVLMHAGIGLGAGHDVDRVLMTGPGPAATRPYR